MARHRSAIFARAVEAYQECRADYGLYLEDVFSRASDEISGNFLNANGRARGIDAFSLFSGGSIRALAYASEELVDWWSRNPRTTFESFERSWPYCDSQPDRQD